ncbi:MAG: sensor histidine kinase [Chitinophagales bacterium]
MRTVDGRLMKRISLHIGFWILYLFQDVLLIFLLDTSRLQQLAVNQRIHIAIESCCVCLVPKWIFTYFMLYVILGKISRSGVQRTTVFYSIFALAGAVFFYKMLVLYFVDPVIYGGLIHPVPFFNLLSFLVVSIDIGFVSGVAIAIKQVRLQLAGKEIERNLSREKLEAELKFLRNQTNPHFLFNTLNNIYALARKKSEDTPIVVMKLSRLLRFMLYETQKPLIKIGEEVQMLNHYIELEKIRYNGRLAINFLKEIDDETELISPLLLLPFIENAFKHGVSESRFQSYIHIDMKLKNSVLNFNIENTKESNGDENNGENIGLNNVKRQLELMYSNYSMQVQNVSPVFRVCLTINLKTHAKI